MFERFAGVFHAFSSLRTRIDASVAGGLPRQAGLAMYAEQFDSPLHVLRLVQSHADEDLPLAYVTYGSARLLDAYVAVNHPELVEQFARARTLLRRELDFEAEIRRRLIEEADQDDMAGFLDWFDQHFTAPAGPTA